MPVWFLGNVAVCLLCFLSARFISNKGFVLKHQLGITMFSVHQTLTEEDICKKKSFVLHEVSVQKVFFLCTLPYCS